MKHIFVINPAAGQGKSLDFIRPKIEEVAKKFPVSAEFIMKCCTGSTNIYKVTLNNQSATTSGTSAYWYIFNTTKKHFILR